MGGVMVVASMYPASILVAKTIRCEYTTLRYGLCNWSVIGGGGGGGGYVVASMYPASILVAKTIKCEYTTLRYGLCYWSVILEHRYLYTKHILNSTIVANIEVCFIRMQCVIEASISIFKML